MKLVTGLILFAAGVALVLGLAGRSHSTPPAYAAPAYGGGAPYLLLGQQQAGIQPSDAKRMLELQEAMLAEQQTTNRHLEVIAGKLGAPVAQAAPKIDRAALLRQNCASCHRPGNAKGDFVIVNDDKGDALKFLSAAEKAKVTNRVQDGSMPPNKKLTAAERAAVKW